MNEKLSFETWFARRTKERDQMMVSVRVSKLPCGCMVKRGNGKDSIIYKRYDGSWYHPCVKIERTTLVEAPSKK